MLIGLIYRVLPGFLGAFLLCGVFTVSLCGFRVEGLRFRVGVPPRAVLPNDATRKSPVPEGRYVWI